MIYSPSTTAALGIVEDAQPEEPLTLRGEGLWVCLISSGKCVVSLSDLDPMPAVLPSCCRPRARRRAISC